MKKIIITICSRRPNDCKTAKTSHFISFNGQKQLRHENDLCKACKMAYCFSLNMQNFHVLVLFVVEVA